MKEKGITTLQLIVAVVVTAIVVGGVVFSLTGGRAPAKEKVKAPYAGVGLTVLTMRMDSTEYINEKAKEFEEETGADVTFEWLGERDLRAIEVEDMSTGVGAYQIVQAGTQHIPLMAANNWIVPLEDYFTKKFDFYKGDYKADEFVKGVVIGASYKGIQYAVPIYHEATHLMYRHDVFEDLGLEPPETLEETKQVAKTIVEKTDMAGIVLRGARGAGLNHISWKQYLHAFGGKWLKSFEKPFEPAFDSPEGRKATKWYTDMIRNYAPEGSQANHWRDVQAMFMAGDAAMAIDATSIGRRVVSDPESKVIGKTSFALFPKGPAGRFPWYFSWNLAVSKVGTKGLTRRAAIDFVLWATSPEMKKNMMLEIGTLPARTSTLQSKEAQEHYGKKGMSNWLSNTIKSLNIKEAAENPVVAKIPEWPAIGDTIGIYLEDIFTGGRSVEDGLAAAAKAVREKTF